MSPSTRRKTSAIERVTRDPVSRRKFFLLTGGTGSAAAFLAACGDDNDMSSTAAGTSSTMGGESGASSQFGEGDLGIVNYALTLEYLETAFYNDVAKSGLFKGDQLALIKAIAKTEQQHVDALTATAKQLGGPVAPEPKAEFPLKDAKSVLELAATVENLGAAAYLGQAAAIENPDILAAALSIHSVEGRHAAVLNVLTGQEPTPDGAFAQGADMQTVLDAVQPFLA
jgi:rubrerythrin